MSHPSLGWTSELQAQWFSLVSELGFVSALVPARVTHEERGHYRLLREPDLPGAWGEVSGRFRHGALARRDFPAVGDWVACVWREDPGRATVHAVLPRRSLLVRAAPGGASDEQVLAANVDLACVISSLNADLNPRRIERYLAALWDTGVQPLIVLTKADLHPEPHAAAAEIEAVAPGVAVLVTHALDPDDAGLANLRARLLQRPGLTAVLLGSSGVGKSTLTNALLGSEVAPTQAIRADDDRGRHTTTGRSLHRLPRGGMLIDTPGMRELALAGETETGVAEAFEEVEALVRACRFTDCGHGGEPGCAVAAALAEGTLAPERRASWEKLRREAEYQERKLDQAAASRAKARWKKRTVQAEAQARRKRWET